MRRNRFLADEFLQSYQWLKARVRRRVESSSDAEDVASAAFVELAEVDDLAMIREPRALLTTIAHRLIFEIWRRRDLERAYLDALSLETERVAVSPQDIFEMSQALLAVDRALNGLSSNARRAFLYSQLDGLTYAEISDLLGVSVGMVRKYIAKALIQCIATK